MEGTSDMERKGCESIGCWSRYVILTFELTHNLELGFPGHFFFQIAISQEWEGRMTSNKRDVNRMDQLIWNKGRWIALTLDFRCWILKINISEESLQILLQSMAKKCYLFFILGPALHSCGDIRNAGVSTVGILVLSGIELAPVTFIFVWLFNICAAGGIALAKLERSIEK